MLLQDEVKLLRKLPLLSGIDPGRLKLLCFASERHYFEPGQVLFSENDESFGAYVVISGTVEVQKSRDAACYRKTGSPEGVAIVGQSSMMNDRRRRATVTAVTEVEALRINSECFLKLMATCPNSSESIMRSLGAQIDDNDQGRSADSVAESLLH